MQQYQLDNEDHKEHPLLTNICEMRSISNQGYQSQQSRSAEFDLVSEIEFKEIIQNMEDMVNCISKRLQLYYLENCKILESAIQSFHLRLKGHFNTTQKIEQLKGRVSSIRSIKLENFNSNIKENLASIGQIKAETFKIIEQEKDFNAEIIILHEKLSNGLRQLIDLDKIYKKLPKSTSLDFSYQYTYDNQGSSFYQLQADWKLLQVVEFRNLKRLQLTDCEITNIEPLSRCLSKNSIKDIIALTAFPKLQSIYLNENPLKLISLEFQSFKQLIDLNLSKCELRNMQFVKTISSYSLKKLYLNDNQIQTIDDILNAPIEGLEVLQLDNNNIINIGVLARLTSPKLRIIGIAYNQITDLAPLNRCNLLDCNFINAKQVGIYGKFAIILLKSQTIEKISYTISDSWPYIIDYVVDLEPYH